MLERLIEGWLDSASERSYQAPFCQILAAEGHKVVHSTRHAPIEFGKDVITIGPDNVPCAFQLKGNPGTRMTLAELRNIKPQLLELATQSIVYPGVSSEVNHRCFLVTNGYIDEEVQRSIDDINRELEKNGFGRARIEVWSRGRLLEKAISLGASLWPSELSDLNTLLEVLVHGGDDHLPTRKFHSLFQKLLGLSERSDEQLGSAEVRRRIASAAILCAVGLRTFSQNENWFAIATAWTMFATYAIAATERHRAEFDVVAAMSVKLAEDAIYDALASLCDEVEQNPLLISHSGVEIGPIYQGRATLVYALMSAYWFWSEDRKWPVARHRDFLAGWMPTDFDRSFLWGEGAVPQMLCHYWYISRVTPDQSAEFLLGRMLLTVINCCLGRQPFKFPSPYFSFESVMRHHLSAFLNVIDDPLRDENASGTSFFAEGLFHLFVRANLKISCKTMWPDFSRLGLKRFEPAHPWQYGLCHSDEGKEVMVQPAPTKEWSSLVDEARDCRADGVPTPLLERPSLLQMFTIMFPHRGTPAVVRYLGRRFGTVWFLPSPIV